jgi:uncharacterized protein (TIGR02391 family)
MDLPGNVKPQLWSAISQPYEAADYSHAILSAMHYMSETLRERTGLDGDGAKLVDSALGGNPPRLRVNKFQTQTEKDVQTGLAQLLRGMYQAIRNPRAHGLVQDDQHTADAIVLFANYLVDLLDKSRVFTIEGFLEQVFEPAYVPDLPYAQLLADEIPPSRRADTLIAIWRRKREKNAEELVAIVREILTSLSSEQKQGFAETVSDELRKTKDDTVIRSTFQLLPASFWPQLDEVARRRTENRVLQSLKAGAFDKKNNDGWLATWARDFIPHFITKDAFALALAAKVEVIQLVENETWMFSLSEAEARYGIHYFLNILPEIVTKKEVRSKIVKGICVAVKGGVKGVKYNVVLILQEFPEDWQREFVAGLANPDRAPENEEITFLRDNTMVSLPSQAELKVIDF